MESQLTWNLPAMLRYTLFIGPVVLAALWFGRSTEAQLPIAADAAPPDTFPFVVVESFDAKYEGDTPGHLGRHGGLGDRVPRSCAGGCGLSRRRRRGQGGRHGDQPQMDARPRGSISSSTRSTRLASRLAITSG
ncbi:MAG: hypothetical protein QM775_17305 [Pirellulales bacterium]